MKVELGGPLVLLLDPDQSAETLSRSFAQAGLRLCSPLHHFRLFGFQYVIAIVLYVLDGFINEETAEFFVHN